MVSTALTTASLQGTAGSKELVRRGLTGFIVRPESLILGELIVFVDILITSNTFFFGIVVPATDKINRFFVFVFNQII